MLLSHIRILGIAVIAAGFAVGIAAGQTAPQPAAHLPAVVPQAPASSTGKAAASETSVVAIAAPAQMSGCCTCGSQHGMGLFWRCSCGAKPLFGTCAKDPCGKKRCTPKPAIATCPKARPLNEACCTAGCSDGRKTGKGHCGACRAHHACKSGCNSSCSAGGCKSGACGHDCNGCKCGRRGLIHELGYGVARAFWKIDDCCSCCTGCGNCAQAGLLPVPPLGYALSAGRVYRVEATSIHLHAGKSAMPAAQVAGNAPSSINRGVTKWTSGKPNTITGIIPMPGTGTVPVKPVKPAVPAAPSNVKPVAVPAAPATSHNADYTTIRGRLEKSTTRGGAWMVRYAGIQENDPHGGVVVLAYDRRVANFNDGDMVQIDGQIVGAELTRYLGGPLFKMTQIARAE